MWHGGVRACQTHGIHSLICWHRTFADTSLTCAAQSWAPLDLLTAAAVQPQGGEEWQSCSCFFWGVGGNRGME